MILFVHIISSALWIGTAATLPFWGNRANRADHLHTVLGIIDTVFILKCIFIMGGLTLTLGSGFYLAHVYGFSLLPFSGNPGWLDAAMGISLVILANSWVIFYFLLAGRKGRRSLMRVVPPIGYTNIGLIITVMYLMVVKPAENSLVTMLSIALGFIVLANAFNAAVRLVKLRKLRGMAAKDFAEMYFGFLNDERMTDLMKLFRDDARFVDPFATGPVNGILAIERFFQKLGDQFESIKMFPKVVSGTPEEILIHWEAVGITKNGQRLDGLLGTNRMRRCNGKIKEVLIEFDLNALPQVQLVSV